MLAERGIESKNHPSVEPTTTTLEEQIRRRDQDVMMSPFPPSQSKPGYGEVHLTLLPPAIPSFGTLTYTYPLKLLPSTPHILRPSSPSIKDISSTQTDVSATPTAAVVSDSASPLDKEKKKTTKKEKRSFNVPRPINVPLLFLLTYGGGLLAGDTIFLKIRLDAGTRLAITTQGSTKVYRPAATATETNATILPPSISTSTSTSTNPPRIPETPSLTRQDLLVRISAGAALWLAPDLVQPFAGSYYAQSQIFEVERGGSLGVVDWISEGRTSRGEKWAFCTWKGRNEIWSVDQGGGNNKAAADDDRDGYGAGISSCDDGGGGGGTKTTMVEKNQDHQQQQQQQQQQKPELGNSQQSKKKTLLVRDAVVLEGSDLRARMDGMGCFGTLLLTGPLFSKLGAFFIAEFAAMPRIGSRNWDHPVTLLTQNGHRIEVEDEMAKWQRQRVAREKEVGILWTACRVRGVVVVVKFSSRDVEGCRWWLGEMLRRQGMVLEEFGPGGMMFVR